MAEKKVSELTSASSINLSDLFLLTQDLGQGEYDSLKMSASLLATWLASQVQFPLLLTETTAKDIIGAINEIATNGGGGAVFLHTQLGTTTIDEDADDIYDAYTNEKLLCLSVLANGQYLLFACTKQTDYTIGDGVTLEFEGEVEGYKWLYVIHVDATNDTVTLERTTTELPTIEDIQELHDEIVSMLPTESASGAVVSFETPLTLPLVSHNVTIEPVQSGTGDPSPSNIRPISGWNAVNVTRTGKNLLNSNASVYYNYTINEDGTENTNNANKRITTDYMECKPNISLTVSGKKVVPNSNVFSFVEMVFYDKDKNYISRASATYTDNPLTATTPSNTAFVRYGEYHNDFTQATPAYFATYQRQLQIGTTATDYEPYTGQTYTRTFLDSNDDPVTVYGGSENLIEGEGESTGMLLSNWDDATLQSVNQYGIANFQIINRGRKINGYKLNSLGMPWQTSLIANEQNEGIMYTNIDTVFVRLKSVDYPTIDSFITWANSNLQILFELATPQTFHTTPLNLDTLEGVNNIYADTGDTAVEYKQDIQTYIDSRLSSGTRSLSLAKAPVETKEETKQEEQEEKEETKTEEEVENDAER